MSFCKLNVLVEEGESQIFSSRPYQNLSLLKQLNISEKISSNDHLHCFLKISHNENVSISHFIKKHGPYGEENIATHKNLCNFKWNVVFPFDPGFDLKEDVLKISVYTTEFGRDRKIKEFQLSCDNLIHAEGKANAILLFYVLDKIIFWKKPLTLQVKYWWEVVHEDEGFPIPTLQLIQNRSIRGGVTSMMLGQKLKPFKTWQIQLWNVKSFFHGDLCSWNQDYEPAKKIFESSKAGKALRVSIRAQYQCLYRKDCKLDKIYEARKFFIRNLSDLVDTLPKGDEQNGNSNRFTYVIREDSLMNFSVTSKKKCQDLLSKHALHNNAFPEVVYAGEFFFDWKSKRFQETGIPALIIDNNSGTYSPTKERLRCLKALLEFNFGTVVPIIAVDRNDPVLRSNFVSNNIQ